mgnify:CR=1 FL=1
MMNNRSSLFMFQNPAAAAAISAANAAQLGGADPNDPKVVLHIIVDNLIYPVSIDVLKQVCLLITP